MDAAIFSSCCLECGVFIRLPCKSGADVNAVDNCGRLPIWQAALHENLEGVRFLAPISNLDKRNKDGETILHAAAYGGSLEMVQLLVAAGADISAKSASVSSVLHRAAEAGNTEIVRWLFDTHAPPPSASTTLHPMAGHRSSSLHTGTAPLPSKSSSRKALMSGYLLSLVPAPSI